MIRFKCVYCGQRMLAPDDSADKKGKCPKCDHVVVVPWTTKGRPAISVDKEPMPDRSKPYVPAWDKPPDFWLKDRRTCFIESPDELIDLYEENLGFLIPTYDELSMFLMAVIWLLMTLVYTVNSQLLRRISLFLNDSGNWSAFAYLSFFVLIFFIGLVLCIYHIFTTREKTDFEKKLMLGFAVVTNILVGVLAGIYVIKHTTIRDWQLIFPIWNMVNGLLLLLMFQFGIVNEDCIIEREVTGFQIILGLVAVLIIFILCNFIFKLHWAVTFSICIIYTTSFDRALQNVLPGLKHIEDEQVPLP